MDLINNYLITAAVDTVTVNLWICGIILGIAVAFAIVMAVVDCQLVYVDPETNYEIHYEKHQWLSKVYIKAAKRKGKKFIGWSVDPEGKRMLVGDYIRLTHTVQLYAVWEDVEEEVQDSAPEVPVIAVAPESKEESKEDEVLAPGSYIELVYFDKNNTQITKEHFKIDLATPDGYNYRERFIGWALEKDGEAVITKSTPHAVFTIPFYPIFNEEHESKGKDGNARLTVEFSFINSNDSEILNSSHDITPHIPHAYSDEKDFAGWGLENGGDVVISDGSQGTVLTIQLFSVYEAMEAPVIEEEPVVEKTVAEEEPVVEETAAEEEPVVEEAAAEEEPVVEEAAAEEEPVAEEPAAEEKPVVEETVAEEEPVAAAAESNVVIVPTYFDSEGNKIDIKYSRSFTANIIQGDETVKAWYSELKNHIMSYDGVKSRISWKFDSYNKGRYQLFKMKLRGKTILLYCGYDPAELDESKYHHEVINNKLFEDVPTLIKVKSKLGLRKAKEVVDMVMNKFGIQKSEKPKEVDYVAKYPYEETDALLEKKLVKVLVSDADVIKKAEKPPVVEEPVVEEPVVEEPVVEEPVVEEPVVKEPVVEEPHMHVVESVEAYEVDDMASDEEVDSMVEEDVDYVAVTDTKREIVNIDTLSKNYEAGETVDLASLKAKKLVDKKTKSIKVLARGRIDKPLTIKAGEFSKTALKMIFLTGGKAIHVTYKIK